MQAIGVHSAPLTNASARNRSLAQKIVQMAERESVNPY
jgi:hypothetical protein